MRILVAPDKFKGSLGAAEVAENIAAGLREALPAAEITLLPIADGGEGTAEVICSAADGEWQSCHVQDANGDVGHRALLHDRRRRNGRDGDEPGGGALAHSAGAARSGAGELVRRRRDAAACGAARRPGR